MSIAAKAKYFESIVRHAFYVIDEEESGFVNAYQLQHLLQSLGEKSFTMDSAKSVLLELHCEDHGLPEDVFVQLLMSNSIPLDREKLSQSIT